MRSFSVKYIITFSLMICGVCAVIVSTLAVSLEERQEINEILDRQRNVLMAAGLVGPDDKPSPAEIEQMFSTFVPVVVDLQGGGEVDDIEPTTFDQQKAKKDPDRSRVAPPNQAGVPRIPNRALVYKQIGDDGQLLQVVLPVEGYGLWSTLYGFLSLDSDLNTILGLAFYSHAETPGLGGEVDNPNWRAKWPGRRAFDDDWVPKIEVIKGAAAPANVAPYEVDGLSGATITARGVSNMMKLWLGEEGFGPYLANLRDQRGAA